MMGIDPEYGIKQDVRNNPIVREIDRDQRRQFLRNIGITALVVGMLLFSAWQHYEVWRHGFEIEAVDKQRAAEDAINRKLRLELDTLRSPARIEYQATTDLHMVVPTAKDTLVVERVTPAPADHSAVASVR
jgi:cell division protein FtsL